MTLYRKKPVVVEAITFDELVAHGIASGSNVVGGMPWSFEYKGHPITHENDGCYLISTAEGTMRMNREDMLITGTEVEIYPCKPAPFAATYERVISESTSPQHGPNCTCDMCAANRFSRPGCGAAAVEYARSAHARRIAQDGGYEGAIPANGLPPLQQEPLPGESGFKCAARNANMGANDPQDCDWPVCGCDSYADKVIAALEESGWSYSRPAASPAISLIASAAAAAAGLAIELLEGEADDWPEPQAWMALYDAAKAIVNEVPRSRDERPAFKALCDAVAAAEGYCKAQYPLGDDTTDEDYRQIGVDFVRDLRLCDPDYKWVRSPVEWVGKTSDRRDELVEVLTELIACRDETERVRGAVDLGESEFLTRYDAWFERQQLAWDCAMDVIYEPTTVAATVEGAKS